MEGSGAGMIHLNEVVVEVSLERGQDSSEAEAAKDESNGVGKGLAGGFDKGRKEVARGLNEAHVGEHLGSGLGGLQEIFGKLLSGSVGGLNFADVDDLADAVVAPFFGDQGLGNIVATLKNVDMWPSFFGEFPDGDVFELMAIGSEGANELSKRGFHLDEGRFGGGKAIGVDGEGDESISGGLGDFASPVADEFGAALWTGPGFT